MSEGRRGRHRAGPPLTSVPTDAVTVTIPADLYAQCLDIYRNPNWWLGKWFDGGDEPPIQNLLRVLFGSKHTKKGPF